MTKTREGTEYRTIWKKSKDHTVERGKLPFKTSLWWRKRLWGWLKDLLLSNLSPLTPNPWTQTCTCTHTHANTQPAASLIWLCGYFSHFNLPRVGSALINISTWMRDSLYLVDNSCRLFLSLHFLPVLTQLFRSFKALLFVGFQVTHSFFLYAC